MITAIWFVVSKFIFQNELQEVGFPNNSIYYDMSKKSLKKELGTPQETYTTEIEDCLVYNLEYFDIKGECTFKFYKNKLVNVAFVSGKDSYDELTATEIAQDISKYYQGKHGFASNAEKQNNDLYSYTISLSGDNGATGKNVYVNLNYMGKITIQAESLF